MSLTDKEVTELRKLLNRALELLKKESRPKTQSNGSARRSTEPRTRRSGKDLQAFRRHLKAERKSGVSVAELSKKHGVTASYIYQLG